MRALPHRAAGKIGSPKLELTRDPPSGDSLRLPTERQWKDGMKWQRR
jgi:hypothetical protein